MLTMWNAVVHDKTHQFCTTSSSSKPPPTRGSCPSRRSTFLAEAASCHYLQQQSADLTAAGRHQMRWSAKHRWQQPVAAEGLLQDAATLSSRSASWQWQQAGATCSCSPPTYGDRSQPHVVTGQPVATEGLLEEREAPSSRSAFWQRQQAATTHSGSPPISPQQAAEQCSGQPRSSGIRSTGRPRPLGKACLLNSDGNQLPLTGAVCHLCNGRLPSHAATSPPMAAGGLLHDTAALSCRSAILLVAVGHR